jgi:hypothetical protein
MEIQGHPNYLIYPDGRVFSKKTNKFLTHFNNGTGYKYVSLSPKKNYTIHRLMAIHYLPNPDNLPEVDHINRIRDDNRLENLRWVTREENIKNKGLQKRNNTGFMWVTKMKTRNTYVYAFNRKHLGIKYRCSSKNLSKMLCYSFFYLIKYPN